MQTPHRPQPRSRLNLVLWCCNVTAQLTALLCRPIFLLQNNLSSEWFSGMVQHQNRITMVTLNYPEWSSLFSVGQQLFALNLFPLPSSPAASCMLPPAPVSLGLVSGHVPPQLSFCWPLHQLWPCPRTSTSGSWRCCWLQTQSRERKSGGVRQSEGQGEMDRRHEI